MRKMLVNRSEQEIVEVVKWVKNTKHSKSYNREAKEFTDWGDGEEMGLNKSSDWQSSADLSCGHDCYSRKYQEEEVSNS